MCERKSLMDQGILLEEDEVLQMSELRQKYHVGKLKERVTSRSQTSSSQDSMALIPDERTMSVSIPEEGVVVKNGLEPRKQNFVVTMEGRREFDDLQDIENLPVLDLIYHE
jgi:hypothetical protein